MSLDRLINLAKRTGDRLIVHDPIGGNDIVIMNVDEYEMLLADEQGARDLTGWQLLNQINRDIAIWRANKEAEENYDSELWNKETDNGRSFFDRPEDNFGWQSAGSILEDRYSRHLEEPDNDFIDETEVNAEPDLVDFSGPKVNDLVDEDWSSLAENEKEPDDKNAKDELREVPFLPNLGQNMPGDLTSQNWQEEPLLEDEPVFYEEPV
ncbi:MAG TPA: hypothetical protein DEQ03_15875 [Marinilabiliales bacterium]|nr:hypothetical protein [Marinilabiliales bacterium]